MRDLRLTEAEAKWLESAVRSACDGSGYLYRGAEAKRHGPAIIAKLAAHPRVAPRADTPTETNENA